MYYVTINLCCTAQTCLKPLTDVMLLPLKLQSLADMGGMGEQEGLKTNRSLKDSPLFPANKWPIE